MTTEPPSSIGIIPDMPPFSMELVKDAWQDLDAWERETDAAMSAHTSALSSLGEVKWYIYTERGRLLMEAESFYRQEHRELLPRQLQAAWRNELAALSVHPSTYSRYKRICGDPDGTFRQSGGDLSKVARHPRPRKIAGPATIIPPEAYQKALDRVTEVLERKEKDDERRSRLSELHDNPLYPWMRKLIIQKGKAAGTIRPDAQVLDKHKMNIDRIAQEAGFQDNEYNAFTEALLKLYREQRALNLKGKRKRIVDEPFTPPGQMRM